MSKLYEAQERAVLTEYHDVLVKLADRAAQKQKDAQMPGMQRISREAAASSRPLSAPASMTDAPQQLMSSGVSQGEKREETEKTAPFGVNLMRSLVIYQAAQSQSR